MNKTGWILQQLPEKIGSYITKSVGCVTLGIKPLSHDSLFTIQVFFPFERGPFIVGANLLLLLRASILLPLSARGERERRSVVAQAGKKCARVLFVTGSRVKPRGLEVCGQGCGWSRGGGGGEGFRWVHESHPLTSRGPPCCTAVSCSTSLSRRPLRFALGVISRGSAQV